MMYRIFRPVFFLFSPEAMHGLVAWLMRVAYAIPPLRALLRKIFCVVDPALEREFCGIKFSNPVGLAAGFDKNATLYPAFSTLGFSFIEIGTVTPKAQPGNPKPRIFRIPQDEAIINRMGLNNKGVDAAVEQLKKIRPGIIIGGNIGKNNTTSNEDAPADYLECFKKLYPYVDYFTVNVSCPNVANLSKLQDTDSLSGIISALLDERKKYEKYKPILLKISPDLNFVHLNEVVDIVTNTGIDGIVAINTTTKRTDLSIDKDRIESIGNGGLSGRPLTWRTLEVINYIRQHTRGTLPIIGVGGVMSAGDAINMIRAGATLVQIYSGMIYEGPALVKKINKEILRQGNIQ